jgi:hypothetical protein
VLELNLQGSNSHAGFVNRLMYWQYEHSMVERKGPAAGNLRNLFFMPTKEMLSFFQQLPQAPFPLGMAS